MELSKKNQRDKEWLDTNSDSFKALQTFVLDKTLNNDIWQDFPTLKFGSL